MPILFSRRNRIVGTRSLSSGRAFAPPYQPSLAMTPLRRRGPVCAEEGADFASGIWSFGSFHGNTLTSAFGASIAASIANRIRMRWDIVGQDPWGRQCGGAILSKCLAPARAQRRRGLRVRIVEDGEVSRCRQTPFAALSSMRTLAPEVIR